ncbi:hypothetical protein M427DRAFT_265169 [Gonapodya prolifera JEL478]|uniref:Uncharacterized protein n=1 Tax=Gonapodya prolifera (strain JEL478) TaxID=1344416 RepID=A0A139AL41_GONPJ|nr:hypothetical protein M427DRAFT_265169 [Gonapodya prolifera JEL478]|eukprot:KXS17213.1 hypothetical protein M427DRAFT_265169 [Gonapodya prolifera JEL478]
MSDIIAATFSLASAVSSSSSSSAVPEAASSPPTPTGATTAGTSSSAMSTPVAPSPATSTTLLPPIPTSTAAPASGSNPASAGSTTAATVPATVGGRRSEIVGVFLNAILQLRKLDVSATEHHFLADRVRRLARAESLAALLSFLITRLNDADVVVPPPPKKRRVGPSASASSQPGHSDSNSSESASASSTPAGQESAGGSAAAAEDNASARGARKRGAAAAELDEADEETAVAVTSSHISLGARDVARVGTTADGSVLLDEDALKMVLHAIEVYLSVELPQELVDQFSTTDFTPGIVRVLLCPPPAEKKDVWAVVGEFDPANNGICTTLRSKLARAFPSPSNLNPPYNIGVRSNPAATIKTHICLLPTASTYTVALGNVVPPISHDLTFLCSNMRVFPAVHDYLRLHDRPCAALLRNG